ncbi:MAG: D-alpha,beta-D-heptose 1,7-bisphosphate phosphatase [Chthoniobacteraceae bacterium]|nr:D-alpha,beta-D-heptose 1,7-bisphosphate phosphatase [Chthoniobacteraceae bacterium]
MAAGWGGRCNVCEKMDKGAPENVTLLSVTFHSPTPAVFLDRDGTLMEEVDYCRDPARVSLFAGVREALGRLKEAGFFTVIVSNQSGIGRGRITMQEYEAVHARLLELIGEELIDAAYFCPDKPGDESLRRKPAPGMLLEAAREHALDLSRSWMIGDKAIDMQCGRNAGVQPILVETGYGANEDASGAEFVAKDFATAADFILKQCHVR